MTRVVSVEQLASGDRVLSGDAALVEPLNKFLFGLKMRGASPRTLEAYAYDLVLVYDWLVDAGKTFDGLCEPDLTSFIAHERDRGSDPRSINRRLATLRSAHNFVVGRELEGGRGLVRSPKRRQRAGRASMIGLPTARHTPRPRLRVREPQRLVEPLTPAQVKSFLESLRRYRDVGIVYLMLFCGLRSCEILAAQIADIDFLDRRLKVRGKGQRERAVPLPALVRRALSKYLDLEHPKETDESTLFVVLQGPRRGQAMTRTGLRRIFRSRRAQELLRDANPHRFRHTFGADMARAGVRLPVLQKMMGHAEASTTLRYINLSMADIAEAYNRAVVEIERRYDARMARKP